MNMITENVVLVASILNVALFVANMYLLFKRSNDRINLALSNIRFKYDDKARMGYIYLNDRDGSSTRGINTREIAPGVFGDFEISTGELLGLEVFDTRR